MPKRQFWKRKPKTNVAMTKALQCTVTDKKITGRAKKVQKESQRYTKTAFVIEEALENSGACQNPQNFRAK